MCVAQKLPKTVQSGKINIKGALTLLNVTFLIEKAGEAGLLSDLHSYAPVPEQTRFLFFTGDFYV